MRHSPHQGVHGGQGTSRATPSPFLRRVCTGLLALLVVFSLSARQALADGTVAAGDAKVILANETLSGAWTIDAGGSLVVMGTGHAINSGALTNAGTITNAWEFVNTGTLTSSGTIWSGRDLTNSGVLTNSGTLTNSGWLANSGTLTNANGGTLTNSIANTLINTGTLNNSGVISGAGTLTNASGGTLNNYATGTLSQGTLKILSGSTLGLAVGSSLSATNLWLSSGATYSLLGSTTGSITLTSTNPILDDTGAVSSGFSRILASTALSNTTMTLVGGASTATLVYTAKSLGSTLGGGNGGAFDAVRLSAAPGSSTANFFNTLYGSNDLGQIQTSLQQTAGEGVLNGAQLVLGQAQAFHAAMGQQMGSFSGGAAPLALSAAGGLWSTASQAGFAGNGVAETLAQVLVMNNAAQGTLASNSFGGKGQVQWIHQGARGGLSGYNAEMGLAAVGYDAAVADNARLGLSAGFSAGQSRGAGASIDLKTWFAGLYGSLGLGGLVLDGDLTYARTFGDLTGRYTFPVAASTTGHYAADTFSGALKASHTYRFNGGETRLTPSVGLEASTTTRGAFTESGTGLSKRFTSSTMNTVALPVGAAFAQDFSLGKTTLTPELSAYYVRQLADTQATGRMTLLDSTTSSVTKGADAGRDLYRANFGAKADLGDGFALSLFYNGEFGDRYQNNGLTVEAKYAF